MIRVGSLLRACSVLMVLIGLAPGAAEAQTTNKEFVRTLFFYEISQALGEPVGPIADVNADAVTRFITLALSTTPISSSSAGFSFGAENKTTGQRPLRSESFGPTFADRPLTNGRGVASLGFNYQFGQTRFAGAADITADGRDVGLPVYDNIVTYTDGVVQYITRRAFVEARSQSFNVLFGYGITDRVDIGVLVPIVTMTIKGYNDEAWSLEKTRDRQPTTGSRVTQTFPNTSATGVGDITFRVKYGSGGETETGFAVAADVRLPTGSEDDLLGSGKASVKLQALIAKANLGPAAVHANAGYTAGGLSHELNYIVGTDAALGSRKQLTASFSFLGRTLRSGATPSILTTVNRDQRATAGNILVVNRFEWNEQAVTLLQVAAGIKFNITGNWLLGASVLVPLNQRGFQPGISPVIGLERTWTK